MHDVKFVYWYIRVLNLLYKMHAAYDSEWIMAFGTWPGFHSFKNGTGPHEVRTDTLQSFDLFAGNFLCKDVEPLHCEQQFPVNPSSQYQSFCCCFLIWVRDELGHPNPGVDEIRLENCGFDPSMVWLQTMLRPNECNYDTNYNRIHNVKVVPSIRMYWHFSRKKHFAWNFSNETRTNKIQIDSCQKFVLFLENIICAVTVPLSWIHWPVNHIPSVF